MLDSVWILLALLQGPAPVAAPPLPAVVDAGLLPASATGVRHQWEFAKAQHDLQRRVVQDRRRSHK
jgi:hypothetical protein